MLKQLEHKLLEHPDLSALSAEEQFKLIKTRAKHIVGETRLLKTLQVCKQDSRPMRVKYGIDATGKDIHLGHAVPLFVLRRLQKMGHHIVLLIGDFTARVGDPSGRISTRPMLSVEQIKENASHYSEQAGRVLDITKTEVRFNNEWLEPFPLARFFQVLSGLTVSTALQRDDFRRRESITRAEMLYSTLMAIDSVELNSELEIGGDDQLLNFYDAEHVMINEGMIPEAAITTDILLGTTGDGKKMSKSLENFISINAAPEEKYGKLMSIPDNIVHQYFLLLTDISNDDWNMLTTAMENGSVHPMDVKRLLARVIVSDLDGTEAAKKAEDVFNQSVVNKEAPEDIVTKEITKTKAISWVAILRTLNIPQADTNTTARRLMDGNGVHRIDNSVDVTIHQDDAIPNVGETVLLRIGKRTYVQFVIK